VNVPRRVFLDTNVVNFVLDHDGCIFENEVPRLGLSIHDLADIDALQLIFATGQRAHWELAVSPITYAEILATTNIDRKNSLQRWFGEIWAYWRDCFNEDGTLSDVYAHELATKLDATTFLAIFPDAIDRELISHAIAYECDAFCTRDRRTILKHVGRSEKLPLEIISPAEWGQRVQKVAGLF
jgi:hypothetical protein